MKNPLQELGDEYALVREQRTELRCRYGLWRRMLLDSGPMLVESGPPW